jgi:uncharacterized repeat protein (TIGR01451 family)
VSPIPSRTLMARIAGRLRIAALVALLLTHIPLALGQSPAVMLSAPIPFAQPEPPARTMPAAAGVTASKTDAPLADTNRNGRSDPGETLRYTVVVSNSSGTDLTGVAFDDTLDANTNVISGSLQISPLAFGDSYSTLRNTPLVVVAPGVLFNDSGTPAPSVIPSSVTTAAGGNATTGADGTFSYTPPPGYTGIDSFSYSATNSAGSDIGVVTLVVRAVPVAVDDSYAVSQNSVRSVSAPGVLANDLGFPPPSVTPFSGVTTAGGSVTVAGNGGFSYSAPDGFVGDDTFIYTAVNAAGSDTGTVTMTVGLAPLAQDDPDYVTLLDTPLSVAPAAGVLQNDTLGSPAATVLSFGGGALPGTAASNAAGTTVSFGTGGALKVNADGSFAFSPSAGFAGPFSFGYRIGNLFGTSDAIATINMQQLPAITSSDAATFTVGTPGNFTITASGFPTPTLARGGDPLPSGVTFIDNGNGSATLSGTPGSGTGGVYMLTFTATNSDGTSPAQSFTLTILEVPSITSDASTIFEVGVAGNFVVTTSGYPTPTIDLAGTLPSGVTFVDNGDGTGTLSGTPSASGSFPLMLTAANSVGSFVPQSFTLTVQESTPIAHDLQPAASTVTAEIGTIPVGKHVTILFDVAIANPLPVGVGQISNQGTVMSNGLAAVLTDDPRKPGASDPTITFLGARKIYLPLMMLGAGPPLPDLVVSSITASGGNLQVTIRNNGALAAVEPFWVDAYINPTSAPVQVNQLWNNVGNRGATWGVVGSVLPLEPGETLTLTVGDAYYRSALSNPAGPITAGTQLYAQADAFNASNNNGAVLETHELYGGVYNNILGPVAVP